jgi:hypothetical protein
MAIDQATWAMGRALESVDGFLRLAFSDFWTDVAAPGDCDDVTDAFRNAIGPDAMDLPKFQNPLLGFDAKQARGGADLNVPAWPSGAPPAFVDARNDCLTKQTVKDWTTAVTNIAAANRIYFCLVLTGLNVDGSSVKKDPVLVEAWYSMVNTYDGTPLTCAQFAGAGANPARAGRISYRVYFRTALEGQESSFRQLTGGFYVPGA